MNLSKYETGDLIQRLQKGENIPHDYKYKLFPTQQKEYELVYGGKMRKEDVLGNEDGVFPVPLQEEKIFNGKLETWKDGWKSMIVFGDNLQFLKTIYDNKDPLVKDKIKGKIKLIYIDPPFGTGDEYDGNKGQKGYSAKSKGAEFVEFLRRRLIVAREILADDGSIFVRLDYHFGHYVKLVLDEIFGKGNFRNEIIINRTQEFFKSPGKNSKKYMHDTDSLYFFSKFNNNIFNQLLLEREEEVWWEPFLPSKNKPENDYRFVFGTKIFSPAGRKWGLKQPDIEILEKRKRIKIVKDKVKYFPLHKKLKNNWTDIPGYSRTVNYPTENSEVLLERVIKTGTNAGDIILDFFGGSGTTAAVAEKLNRKWITCDIGKLSFYTVQKRILNIKKSKSLENPQKKYDQKAKCFVTLNTGHYDLEKIFKLTSEKYSEFVLKLFEIDPIDKTIGGIKIDGERKDGYYAMIWPYWESKDVAVDEDYLNDLHSYIGKKIGDRMYIIAPISYVYFISDYFEINGVRYYFLKIPYEIIKELHKEQFKRFRQPQSKNNVNDLEDAIGFHFMREPEVVSKMKISKKEINICIKKFNSHFTESDLVKENFESLAMILIDRNFNGRAFDMDDYYFAEDLLPKSSGEDIHLNIPREDCGEKVMLVYIDIFGNEFKESFEIK